MESVFLCNFAGGGWLPIGLAPGLLVPGEVQHRSEGIISLSGYLHGIVLSLSVFVPVYDKLYLI